MNHHVSSMAWYRYFFGLPVIIGLLPGQIQMWKGHRLTLAQKFSKVRLVLVLLKPAGLVRTPNGSGRSGVINLAVIGVVFSFLCRRKAAGCG